MTQLDVNKSNGAPGLAFETWDPRNLSRLPRRAVETPPSIAHLPDGSTRDGGGYH